jgi:PucR-like helix-turn-helix protein/diguanylate cyclase with GGDEF domain
MVNDVSPAAKVSRMGRRGAGAVAKDFDAVCAELAPRLRSRFAEAEAGLATLVDGVSPPRAGVDPTYLEYLDSLKANRPAVLEYAVEVIELGERRAPEVPPPVLAAARLAARAGVPLDTILRRYSAGNAFCTDILVAEAEAVGVSASHLRRLLHRQATLFDRLLEVVSAEHAEETRSRPTTAAQWRHAYIEELLAGRQPNGEMELDYDLDGHHVGLMARGEEAHLAMRELAKRLDRRLLADRRGEPAVWACWLGGRHPLAAEDVIRALADIPSAPVVAVGEPGEGIADWRLTHRQAKAALSIAERRGRPLLRYADVAVLASILRDDLGTTSLRKLYLEPLERTRDGGKAGRETLRAYFATERNISSTAAALGVDRRTVTNRIRAVEELFGRPLGEIATDLETALRLAD